MSILDLYQKFVWLVMNHLVNSGVNFHEKQIDYKVLNKDVSMEPYKVALCIM